MLVEQLQDSIILWFIAIEETIFIIIRAPDRDFATLRCQALSHAQANASITAGNKGNTPRQVKEIFDHASTYP